MHSRCRRAPREAPAYDTEAREFMRDVRLVRAHGDLESWLAEGERTAALWRCAQSADHRPAIAAMEVIESILSGQQITQAGKKKRRRR